MNSGSLKIVINKLFIYKSYIFDTCVYVYIVWHSIIYTGWYAIKPNQLNDRIGNVTCYTSVLVSR